ncbi:MAG: rod shape-determining protein RodA [Syntrophobacterales bacterium]|nr:rod shape-determining protein RodA [Syntrophobacterales bacterium]
MRFDRRLFTHFDWTLLLILLLILTAGLVNLYSAGFAFSQDTSLCLKQIRWIVLGLVCMVLAFSVDYRYIIRHAYFIYGITVVLLLIVLFYGYMTHGSRRWILFMGFSFQPSELMKLAIILVLAKYFDENKLQRSLLLKDLVFPAVLMIVPFFLILQQPDLGTALVVFIIFVSMVLFIGVNWKALGVVCVTGMALLPMAWFLLRDYQKERILTLFAPEKDPLGAGYHIIQSMIAIGSGGWWGKGFLQGTQTHLRFLPEQQTDFVFSVFAEEWGFIGVAILMILFLSLIVWGLKISLYSKDYLGTLIAFGITMLIAWSVFINVGMVLGLLPVVGIPLPFMSYGGSSIVVLLIAMGLLMNISMRRFLLHS